MNHALIQCAIESLRVSGGSEEPLTHLCNFRERDWRKTLPWIDESGLGLHLFEQMRTSDSFKTLPQRVRNRLEQDLATNRLRLSAMRQEFGSLLHAFHAAGVDFAVLKGFALIPEYCPDAALRSQLDYDFLIREDSAGAARRALEALGYTVQPPRPGRQKGEETAFNPPPLPEAPADPSFYTPNIPRPVELHLSLWESIGEEINVDAPTDALDRKDLSNWDVLTFPVLAEDDFLILQALHTFQHILASWCRPSCFLEIAHFLERRQGDLALWNRLRSRAQGRRTLARILGLVFAISELLFHAPVPPTLAEWTTGSLPTPLSLWVRRHGRRWALARFPGSKLSLFVHHAFIEDPRLWKEIARKRLFPLHQCPRGVESGSQGLGSNWRVEWQQGLYAFSRLKFHVGGLLNYVWELPAWKRTFRSNE